MSRFAALLPVLALLLVPAACAPKRVDWKKPGADDERTSRIEAECRSLARNEVERNYRLDEMTESDRGVGGDSVLRQRLNRYDANAEIKRRFESCMRENGYRAETREESK